MLKVYKLTASWRCPELHTQRGKCSTPPEHRRLLHGLPLVLHSFTYQSVLRRVCDRSPISLYSLFQNNFDSVAHRFPNGLADFCLYMAARSDLAATRPPHADAYVYGLSPAFWSHFTEAYWERRAFVLPKVLPVPLATPAEAFRWIVKASDRHGSGGGMLPFQLYIDQAKVLADIKNTSRTPRMAAPPVTPCYAERLTGALQPPVSPEATAARAASSPVTSDLGALLAPPRRCSSSSIIATISSYPRSFAIVQAVVASRCGWMPCGAFAPCRISSRAISSDRFITAQWMARCSSPYDIVKSASSDRAWNIVCTCARSSVRTASASA
jgi:hypothetical protein